MLKTLYAHVRDVLIPLNSGQVSRAKSLHTIRLWYRLNPFKFRAGIQSPNSWAKVSQRKVLIPLNSGQVSRVADAAPAARHVGLNPFKFRAGIQSLTTLIIISPCVLIPLNSGQVSRDSGWTLSSGRTSLNPFKFRAGIQRRYHKLYPWLLKS